MTTFLINVAAFIVFVFAGSLCMCGWYKVTRKGMLLGFWSEFFEALTKEGRDIDAELTEAKEMLDIAKQTGNKENIELYTGEIFDLNEDAKFFKSVKLWYVLPEWLAHPISGCIFCFASIYGTLFYWIVGTVFIKLSGLELSFGINTIVLWIVFMLCSCSLNGILIKKVL